MPAMAGPGDQEQKSRKVHTISKLVCPEGTAGVVKAKSLPENLRSYVDVDRLPARIYFTDEKPSELVDINHALGGLFLMQALVIM